MWQTALQIHGQGLGSVSAGEYRGATTAARFGDPQAEFAALRRGCGVYDLGFRAKIRLAGSDRVRWLNGMVTNNIRDLAVDRGVYAFLLNPQGHILAELEIYALEEKLLVLSHASARERTIATLKKYILGSQVQLEDITDQTASLAVEGPRAATIIACVESSPPEIPTTTFG